MAIFCTQHGNWLVILPDGVISVRSRAEAEQEIRHRKAAKKEAA